MRKVEKVNVVIVDKLQLLESVLSVHVKYKRNFYEHSIAVFTHPTLLRRNSNHPLVQMAQKRFDYIVFPFFGFYRVWSRARESPISLPFGFGLATNLNLILGLVRSNLFGWDFSNVVSKMGVVDANVFFDALTYFESKMVRKIKRKKFVAVSHFTGGFMKPKIPITQNPNFKRNLESLVQMCETNKDLEFYLDENLTLALSTESTKKYLSHDVRRLSPEWLQYVRQSFKGSWSRLENRLSRNGYVLLISRPSSKSSGSGTNPSLKMKKRMISHLKQEIASLNKVLVILPHPAENISFLQRIRSLFTSRFFVVDKIHYLLLIDNADKVVTFGSQLVEDCWRLNKKAIEYRIDWLGDESRFILENKSIFCNDRKDLRRILELE